MFFLVTVPKEKWKISPVVIVLFSLGFLLQLTSGREFYSSQVLFGIAFVVLGYGLSRKELRIIVNPIIRYIGKISFSMYLMHFVVLHWMAKLNLLDFLEPVDSIHMSYLNYGIRFVILLSASVALSSISYKCIELPFQKIGRKIIKTTEKGLIPYNVDSDRK